MTYGSGITFDDLLFSASATGDSFSPKEPNKHCLLSHKKPYKLDNRKKIHTIRECEIGLLLFLKKKTLSIVPLCTFQRSALWDIQIAFH